MARKSKRSMTVEEKKEEVRQRAKKWNSDNPERAAASRRAWYLRNKEKMRKYNLNYRKEHSEELKQKDAERYKKDDSRKIGNRERVRNHPEENRERVKKWQKDNPEKFKWQRQIVDARRRAKMKKVPYEEISPELIYAKDGGICGICGKPLEMSDFSIDHIVPISKGGGHVEGNVHSAHKLCNIRRGNRPLDILYSI